MLNTPIKSYAFALYFISILQQQVFFHFFLSIFVHYRFPLKFIPSVLWHCWVGDRKCILPVKCFVPAILKCSLGDILGLVVIVIVNSWKACAHFTLVDMLSICMS